MIYTGYYAKINEYRDAGLAVVSISRTEPVPVDGKLSLLCPDENLLDDYKSGKIDEMEYTSKYLTWLDKMGIMNILSGIHMFGDDVVLLCWEAPDKFCHRHILADYINRNSGLNITEFGQVEEPSLF